MFDSQYFNFVGGALTGDLGRSYFTRIDVRAGLIQRFPATFELAVTAMILAICIGIPAGVIAALYRGTFVDTLMMIGALSGVSFPVFWLAIILIYIFSINLGWLPPSQRLDVALSFQPVTGMYVLDGLLRGRPEVSWNALKHLVLPGIALGTIPLAIVVRMTRSAMLEVLGQDYIRTAKAKGLQRSLVVNKHALRKRALASRYRYRSVVRVASLGGHFDRNGVFLAGNRQMGLRRDLVERLSHYSGWRDLCGVRLRHRQPTRRPVLRAHRPADSVLVSAADSESTAAVAGTLSGHRRDAQAVAHSRPAAALFSQPDRRDRPRYRLVFRGDGAARARTAPLRRSHRPQPAAQVVTAVVDALPC